MQSANYPCFLEHLRSSDTGKAAGLAGAMIANNVIALISSVVFARLLGDYGSLAALISYLMILTVAGQACRSPPRGRACSATSARARSCSATLERWARDDGACSRSLATVVSILAAPADRRRSSASHTRHGRRPRASPPAASTCGSASCAARCRASAITAAVGLSLVGEQAARLVAGAILAAARPRHRRGLPRLADRLRRDVRVLHGDALSATRRPGLPALAPAEHAASGVLGLWRHVWSAAVPIAALAIIQLLQNIDLIIAKHRFSDRVASSYAVAAVAAQGADLGRDGRELLPRPGDLAAALRRAPTPARCC